MASGYLLGDLGQGENTSLHGTHANSVKALTSVLESIIGGEGGGEGEDSWYPVKRRSSHA